MKPDSREAAKLSRQEAILNGPVFTTMMQLALPTTLVLIAQTLVNVAETYYVSFLGTSALIGVALVFPVWMLMTMMAAGGIGGGVASAVARATGAGKHDDVNALILHSVVVSIVFGLAFTVFFIGFGEHIYAAMGGSGEALSAAHEYSVYVFFASVPIWIVNLLSAVLRGIGNVKVPAAVTLIGALVLIPLSPLLIFGLGPIKGFGLAGAGIAINLFYWVAAFAMLRYMSSGHAGIRMTLVRLRWPLFREILKVGLLAALGTIQLNVMVLLVTGAVGVFGVDAIGGFGTASRLDYVLIPVLFGIGTAIVTMVGINVGARQIDRAKRITWVGVAVSVIFTEVVGLFVAVFPDVWLGLFTHDESVRVTGELYLQIVAPFYAANGILFALGFAAQGSGYMWRMFLAGTVRLILAAGGGWVAVEFFGVGQAGLFVIVMAAMVIAAIMSIAIDRSGAMWPKYSKLSSSTIRTARS
ncbi:MATE family efflux transporter [Pectobacterium sp. PL64]|uniref:MATE family efflux transporter n=1 Tax=Pectobacterium sp. PL64 TaxID=2738983 RepID=UPI001F0BC962|nr:MATE family efflux transporter [Pectobacterium sp. PL64]UMO88863.1 MATE family efflux transporter [Pectobacterium sp. PL64]